MKSTLPAVINMIISDSLLDVVTLLCFISQLAVVNSQFIGYNKALNLKLIKITLYIKIMGLSILYFICFSLKFHTLTPNITSF